MPYIDGSNETKIYFEVLGDSDQTLLFIPGRYATTLVFRDLKILNKDYKIVFLDLPGRGRSTTKRKNHSMRSYAQDIQLVVETLKLNNVIIVGWSMGAKVAIEAAKIKRSNIRGIIEVDSLYPNSLTEDEIKHRKEDLREKGESLIEFGVEQMQIYESENPNLEDEIRLWRMSDPFAIISACEDSDLWDIKDHQIEAPIVAILADQTLDEKKLTIEEYQENFKVKPQVFVIKNLGHAIFRDQFTEFMKVLLKAIKEFNTIGSKIH